MGQYTSNCSPPPFSYLRITTRVAIKDLLFVAPASSRPLLSSSAPVRPAPGAAPFAFKGADLLCFSGCLTFVFQRRDFPCGGPGDFARCFVAATTPTKTLSARLTRDIRHLR